MSSSAFPRNVNRRAVALVIVLAFVVLLTGLIVAFFSQAMLNRQISNSSANATRVDLFAQGAVDTITADLKQEIAAGSNETAYTLGSKPPATVYAPAYAATAVPAQALKGSQTATTTFAPNLVKRSAFQQNFFPSANDSGAAAYMGNTMIRIPWPQTQPTPPPAPATYLPSNRAANVASTMPSLNGRSVSLSRWNKSLLLPKASPTDDYDLTPINPANLGANPSSPTPNFLAPDWVLVARDGTSPGSTSPSGVPVPAPFGSGGINDSSISNQEFVTGRYAYTIYDEGGLLDMNAAGFPTDSHGSPDPRTAYKAGLPFADLTQIPGINNLTTARQQTVINDIVGWRNYASSRPGGSLASANGFDFTGSPLTNFTAAMWSNGTGFLKTANSAMAGGQSDRLLANRQELINLLLQGIAPSGPSGQSDRANLQNALQYLGTFSRDVNQPSYIPPTFTDPTNAPTVLQDGTYKDASNNSFGGNSAFGGDKIVNPSFLEKRVSTAFTRSNGTTANVGDPLVLRRFALSRLSWVTFAGPSAINITSGTMGYKSVAASITAMGGVLANTTSDPVYLFVQQGNAANIYKYFGLTWDPTNHYWVYDHNSVAPPGAPPVPRPAGSGTANIFTLDKITGREPDYFELLKASINVGSLGKHGALPRPDSSGTDLTVSHTDGTVVQYNRDVLTDMQVFQIGANIIDQFDADNYPTRLLVWNPLSTAPATRQIAGVENLPYIYRTRAGCVRLKEPPVTDPASSTDDRDSAKTGAVALFYYPEVWNPHDANSTVVATGSGVSPVNNFRVLFNSADPDHYGSEIVMNLSQNVNNDSYSQMDYADVPSPILSPPKKVSDQPSSSTRTPMMTFSVPAGNATLFREPTVLMAANLPTGANTACNLDSSELSDLSGAMSGGGLMSTTPAGGPIPNGGGTYNGSGLSNLSGPFVGLMMGRTPLKYWSSSRTASVSVGSLMGFNPGGVNGGGHWSMTIRLQYQDAWGNFVTYSERTPPLLDGTATNTLVSGDGRTIEDGFDPRTSRFGMMQQNGGGRSEWDFSQPSSKDFRSLTDRSFTDTGAPSNGPTGLNNRDFGRGLPQTPDSGGSVAASPASGWSGDSHGWGDNKIYELNPCLLVQNDPNVAPSGTAAANVMYADPDGVIRRAMGGYMPQNWINASPAVTVGNPLVTGNNRSRPIILNRPFRTVAELGYTFRDIPWKNLDFFSPESGDAPLLDIFCINDTDSSSQLQAGKVNLNTKQEPVISAILAGAYKDEEAGFSPAVTGSATPLSAIEAANFAKYAFTPWRNSTMAPAQNLAGFISQWRTKTMAGNFSDQTDPSHMPAGKTYGIDGASSYSGFTNEMTTKSGAKTLYSTGVFTTQTSQNVFPTSTDLSWNVQRLREAPTRALTAVGQTRVWNLMIDLVAQTGRYPVSANGLNNFLVEGEQRYWIHLAIDRSTGKVVDKQVEIVKE